MREVKNTLIKTQRTTLFLMAVGLFFALIFKKHFLAYGLVIGAFLGIINFQLLTKSAVAFTSLKGKSPHGRFFLMYMLRFVIIIGVFIACLLKEIKIFTGATIGFLFVQVSIFVNNVLLNNK